MDENAPIFVTLETLKYPVIPQHRFFKTKRETHFGDPSSSFLLLKHTADVLLRRFFTVFSCQCFCLRVRVESLINADSGYPKDAVIFGDCGISVGPGKIHERFLSRKETAR